MLTSSFTRSSHCQDCSLKAGLTEAQRLALGNPDTQDTNPNLYDGDAHQHQPPRFNAKTTEDQSSINQIRFSAILGRSGTQTIQSEIHPSTRHHEDHH